MAPRLTLVFSLIFIMNIVDYNMASRGKRIEEGLNLLKGRIDAESTLRKEDMRTLFERIDSMSAVFNQLKLKEITQKQTELNDRFLYIEQQLLQIIIHNNQTIELAQLKNERIQLKDTCTSKTDAPTLKMDTSTLRTEATTLNNERFKSCLELYEKGHRVSGQYDIYPDDTSKSIRVFCDQDTDGGGWIVFQRRKDGSEDFYRGWLDYKRGFGDLDGEFWLGNEYLSILTSTCCSHLRIDLENSIGKQKYAKYNEFQIKSESEKYSLKVGGYSGNVGRDSLAYHNGQPFTTKDVDNDQRRYINCAEKYKGAWWYRKGVSSNLNGRYLDEDMLWWGFYDYQLTFTEMKFRRLV